MRNLNDKPAKGEVRSYRVQQITKAIQRKDGGGTEYPSNLFIRLPVDHLGMAKGDVVVAAFEDDKIVVSRS